MLELGAGADILRGVGYLYIALACGAIYWVIRRFKGWGARMTGIAVVVAIFGFAPAKGVWDTRQQRKKYQAAKAVFDERCKTAGEKIYRTVDDVEGVLLTKVRPDDTAANRANPEWAGAGLPDEFGGIGYIYYFLAYEHQQFPPRRGYLNGDPSAQPGYKTYPGYSFVDVKEDDGIYRYKLKESSGDEFSKIPVSGPSARYAVSFRDSTNPGDRAMWVAGTTVTITDTRSETVVAEKTWYSFEPGLGSTSGNRAPWGFARSCPELRGWRGAATRMFVDQVLKIKQGS